MKNIIIALVVVVVLSSCTKEYTCSIGTVDKPEGQPIKKHFISNKAKDNWIEKNTINGDVPGTYVQIAECH